MGMFGFLGNPDTKDRAGQIGATLLAIAGNPAGQQLLAQRQVGMKQNEELQRQLALAQFKADNKSDPDVIRSLQAAGIDPRSPQGRAIIANNYSHPIVIGNSETGYTPVGGAFGIPGQPSVATSASPQPTDAAIARLKANPGEAALYDQHFGPGASAKVLNGGG